MPKKPPPEHGTRACYISGCREPECVQANTDYMRRYRGNKPRPKLRHGTRACYKSGCREPECVQANADYQRSYMRMHRDGFGLSDPMMGDLLP